jgi:hypothetical protein
MRFSTRRRAASSRVASGRIVMTGLAIQSRTRIRTGEGEPPIKAAEPARAS